VLAFGSFPARANLEVAASVSIHARADFVAPLTPYGSWIEVRSYGRCWRPMRVTVGWRPYCEGYWVWTDCGWFWVSEEPWAWACYHYGRWVLDPEIGWVWVPDIEWAPAWVSWRVGGGYIGWAPLPPSGFLFAHHPEPPWFVFVGASRFRETIRPSTVVVNNTTVFNQTTEVNNIKRESRTLDGSQPRTVVVNPGPGRAAVEQATGRRVTTAPIQQMARLSPAPPAIARAPNETRGRQNPVVIQPRTRQSVPEHRPTPLEVRPVPAPPPASEAHKPNAIGEALPAPTQPSTPARGPAQPVQPGQKGGEHKGNGREAHGHGPD
jgi:hypothetical protein